MRPTRSRWSDCLAALIAAVSVVAACQEANALITGGEGNSPVNAPGWPAGADAVFNVDSRIAYWEGPPIGGGQMHSECRGDTAAFNEVLKDFAKIDTESRKLVVHDGIGNSVWLNINNGAGTPREGADRLDIHSLGCGRLEPGEVSPAAVPSRTGRTD